MPPVKIPAGLQDSHFFAIKGFLHTILNELRFKQTGARRVVTRLNDSDEALASPVFIGVVEDDAITDVRRQHGHAPPHGDVGKLRFKDKNPSQVYKDTVNNPTGAIVSKHWNGDQPQPIPGGNPRGLGKKATCVHQRFIAIRIADGAQHRHVGTITVGFTEPPPDAQQMAKVKQTMEDWAQKAQSDYVKYLKDTFILNGPTF
jgi:hypothetical protein